MKGFWYVNTFQCLVLVFDIVGSILVELDSLREFHFLSHEQCYAVHKIRSVIILKFRESSRVRLEEPLMYFDTAACC